MINVRATCADGYTSIEVEGHDSHANGGRICAAVSAVIRTALLGLEQIALRHPDDVSLVIDEE